MLDAHRQVLCDWIDGTGGMLCAFDFTTKGILQAAVGGQLWRLKDPEGKPPGLIGFLFNRYFFLFSLLPGNLFPFVQSKSFLVVYKAQFYPSLSSSFFWLARLTKSLFCLVLHFR